MIAFAPLLDLLAEVPDPRRAQGQIYKLPYVLLFSILAIVTGGNSYRSIVTFIDVHRRKLNVAFGLRWAPRTGAHRDPLHPSRARSGRDRADLPPPCRPAAGRMRGVRAAQHRTGWQDIARQLRQLQ